MRLHHSDRVVREATLQERTEARDDPGVFRVQCDTESLGSSVVRDATVAEIDREQFGVILCAEDDRLGGEPAARARLDRKVATRDVGRIPPIPDRRSRNAEPPGDLAVVVPGGYQLECGPFDFRWVDFA